MNHNIQTSGTKRVLRNMTDLVLLDCMTVLLIREISDVYSAYAHAHSCMRVTICIYMYQVMVNCTFILHVPMFMLNQNMRFMLDVP